MKNCKTCRSDKPESEYYAYSYSADRLMYICKKCHLVNCKNYRAQNQEKIKSINRNCYQAKREERLDSQKAYYQINKEKIKEYRRGWSRKHPSYAKSNDLKRKYNLSLNEFNEMLTSQSGSCAICLSPFNENLIPYVDHCHVTQKVRALLCSSCNTSLGLLKENTAILNSMIKYLEAHG